MRLSTRDKLTGTLVEINEGAVNSTVSLDLGGDGRSWDHGAAANVSRHDLLSLVRPLAVVRLRRRLRTQGAAVRNAFDKGHSVKAVAPAHAERALVDPQQDRVAGAARPLTVRSGRLRLSQ